MSDLQADLFTTELVVAKSTLKYILKKLLMQFIVVEQGSKYIALNNMYYVELSNHCKDNSNKYKSSRLKGNYFCRLILDKLHFLLLLLKCEKYRYIYIYMYLCIFVYIYYVNKTC